MKKLSVLAVLTLAVTFAVSAQTPKKDGKPDAKPEAKPEAKPAPVPAPTTPLPPKIPTVAEVVDKYVAAIGGKDAIMKPKTRTMSGTAEIQPMGIKGTILTHQSAPDKIYSRISLTGLGDFIEAYDGTSAWTVNPLQGSRVKAGVEVLQTKLTSAFYRDAMLDKLYQKMELSGIGTENGKEVYIVVATPDGLDPQTFYFDKESGLIVRQDMTVVSPEGKQSTKNYFDDYRDVGGVKIPFKTRSVLPQFDMVLTLTEVKNDAPVDEKMYSKP